MQEIADELPIYAASVSRHLRLLSEAGLVTAEPRGTRRLYRLHDEGVEAVRAYLEQVWGEAGARFKIAAENTRPSEEQDDPAAPDLALTVDCPAEHAFATWAERTSLWWPTGHTVTAEPGLQVMFEPRVDGRIFERTESGREEDWGQVLEWEPPRRLATSGTCAKTAPTPPRCGSRSAACPTDTTWTSSTAAGSGSGRPPGAPRAQPARLGRTAAALRQRPVTNDRKVPSDGLPRPPLFQRRVFNPLAMRFGIVGRQAAGGGGRDARAGDPGGLRRRALHRCRRAASPPACGCRGMGLASGRAVRPPRSRSSERDPIIGGRTARRPSRSRPAYSAEVAGSEGPPRVPVEPAG